MSAAPPPRHGPQFHKPGAGGERQPLRTYSERPKGGLRDVDAQKRAIRTRALLGGVPGLILGTALGVFLQVDRGMGVWIVPACALGMAAAISLSILLIVDRSGRAASVLHNPSGSGTPHKKEYSYAESLVARGMYEEAISAFELAIVEEDASDPVPYLRVARIYRDQLGRHEDAARWFRRVVRDARLERGLEFLARKELVELYRHRMGEPAKAAPELARLAEEWAGTPEGEWAAGELKAVKEHIARPEAEA